MDKLLYNKPKLYKGQNLKGTWHFTTKVDGVRAFINLDDYTAVSRASKPFFNFSDELIEQLQEKFKNRVDPVIDCEVFRNSWEETISLVKKKGYSTVTLDDLYFIPDDIFDRRMNRGYIDDPTSEYIEEDLKLARSQGHEGLVLRHGDRWLKVKPVETYDIVITGYQEGNKGTKNEGKLGAFTTSMGKVGGGFTDALREEFWRLKEGMIGKHIEVNCMELTTGGKFRHPSFVRLRPDKDTG